KLSFNNKKNNNTTILNVKEKKMKKTLTAVAFVAALTMGASVNALGEVVQDVTYYQGVGGMGGDCCNPCDTCCPKVCDTCPQYTTCHSTESYCYYDSCSCTYKTICCP